VISAKVIAGKHLLVASRKCLKVKGMSADIVQFPIAYIITTTSDWTRFTIVEGGYWTNHDVECVEGQNTLTDLLYNRRTILISKNLNDPSRVVVHLK
jgi:hypothetical protein